VVEARHPEVPGNEQPSVSRLTKLRLGRPRAGTGGAGLKLVGGRLPPSSAAAFYDV
jgi:hypothetical protein